MYAVQRGHGRTEITVVIRPDSSMSWRLAKRFFLLIGTVSVTIAGGFAGAGYWLVMPFTGLELLLLGAALYVVCLRNAEVELLRLEPREVVLARGRRRPQEVARYPRAWVKVRVEPGPWPGHPSRLLLGAHGGASEIARGLTEEERGRLARDLRLWLRPRPSPADVECADQR